MGANKLIKYIDGNYITIEIPPFNLNKIILLNKGLLGGNLIVNITLLNISKIKWDNIDIEKKEIFINYIDEIYKNWLETYIRVYWYNNVIISQGISILYRIYAAITP